VTLQPPLSRPSLTRGRHLSRAAAGDAGSVSLLLAVFVLGLFAAVGLVVDGGGRVRAVQHADDVAAEAARAAAQAVSPAVVLGRSTGLDTGGLDSAGAAAAAAARAYLHDAGVQGQVSVSGGRVQVNTSVVYTPVLLSAAGAGPVTVHGRASARLARGLAGEQP